MVESSIKEKKIAIFSELSFQTFPPIESENPQSHKSSQRKFASNNSQITYPILRVICFLLCKRHFTVFNSEKLFQYKNKFFIKIETHKLSSLQLSFVWKIVCNAWRDSRLVCEVFFLTHFANLRDCFREWNNEVFLVFIKIWLKPFINGCF